ncbi:MAG: methyltransferase domain-containing protein [Acidobacteria bacterium]|nr:methyltransferase domain-containing protein [Acidobacteriota bacterium]
MTIAPLSCSVRGCGAPLTRRDRTWTCAAGHTFDIARSGYVNLLQPQDRKSTEAGDSRESVEARAALLARGIGRHVIDAVVDRARTRLPAHARSVVVELGCGSGETLGALSSDPRVEAVGIDLSTPAITTAARRFPSVTWLIANADRRLPLLDGSVDLVLSVHARRNPAECRRILREGGLVIVAVPAHDDLIELREAVQGERLERDRTAALIEEHRGRFEPVEQAEVRQRFDLDRDTLIQLLRGTYRGERQSVSPRVQALEYLEVTLASDIIVFRTS